MKEHIKNFNEEKLKEAFRIKEAYSRGEIPLDMANAQMKAHVGSITPAELAYIEQNFGEMVDDECIKEDLEKMLSIYEGVLTEEENGLPEGHPIRNYIEENNEIRKVIEKIDNLFERKYIKNEWDEAFENLNQWKIHLSRKQNQLYSALERKGFDRPTTTMWLYDNTVRDQISALTEWIKQPFTYEGIRTKYHEFKEHIMDLMDKEENILYPTSLEMLNDTEFSDMVKGDREIGYCLINTPPDFSVKNTQNEEVIHKPIQNDFNKELSELLNKYNMGGWTKDTPMDVAQGIMSLHQINLLFKHLPVDISYVDENDIVAFYSDTKHRVFPRSKGVIGRKVQNCHPANSVEIVEEIISKFRNGEKDRVDFWINKPGVFIYILYVAVREEDGTFRGVLEMMQDCSKIRELEGSQTLLKWAEEKTASGGESEETSEKSKDSSTSIEQTEKEDKITILTPETKVETVLNQYPGLKDYMISRSEKFKMMNSPMFKMVKKIATVQMVSERSGYSMEVLQKEFTKYIESLK